MPKPDPEPPVARVVRGGGSRFRAIAKHGVRLVGRGLGRKLGWIGLGVVTGLGLYWMMTSTRDGFADRQRQLDSDRAIDQRLREMGKVRWHLTDKGYTVIDDPKPSDASAR